MDILFCEAIVKSGIPDDPAKVLEPLKHVFAVMQNQENSAEIVPEEKLNDSVQGQIHAPLKGG